MRRPSPPVTPESAAWWEATREQRLLVQRCTSCGHVQLYPRPLCTRCAATDLTLEDSAGEGTVHSFSVVHRSPDPERFPPPYVVALVRLAEGPVVTTNLVGIDPDEVRCDLTVAVGWEPLEDGRNLPVFTTRRGASTWTSP